MAPAKKSSSSGMGCWLKVIAIVLGVLTPIVYLIEQNLDKFYVFDQEELHALSLRAIAAHGNDTQAVSDYIIADLRQNPKVAPYINPNAGPDWVFNNAGGAMGAMTIIHASITEYLIIFGSAVGTEGHTGRHTADDYFTILKGVQWTFEAGDFERKVYPQGSVNHMHRGTIRQYRMPDECFALEYARGWIPPMLFFGYADLFTSVLDIPTLWYTTYWTGREMIGNLLVGKF